MIDQILTAKELAKYLKVSEITIYKLVNEGALPGFRIGNQWRFKLSEVEAAIAGR